MNDTRGLYAVICKVRLEADFHDEIFGEQWTAQTAWGESPEDALRQAHVDLERNKGCMATWLGTPQIIPLAMEKDAQ